MISLLLPAIAKADRYLTDKEILGRCYAQLTGQRLSISDPLWSQLQTTSATSLCTNLIDQVQLGSNGVLTQDTQVNRNILKQFHDFHRSWLPNHWSFNNSFIDSLVGTVDIYDANEPSLFVTRALFSQTPLPYSTVLQGYQSLAAIRDGTTVTSDARGSTGTLRASRVYYSDMADPSQESPANILDQSAVTVLNPTPSNGGGTFISIPASLLQIGQMRGIQTTGDTPLSIFWVDIYTPHMRANPAGYASQNFHTSFGGGALGSIPYMMLYLGQATDYTANGSTKLPRRAIMTAFNTFLCLSGPFSRATDVGAFLASADDVNAAPFRQSQSCLRCHATMDPAALTMRNIRFAGTAEGFPSPARATATMVSISADMPPASPFWPTDPTPNFERTPPQGRLFFRSYTGALIDQSVSNLDGLGQAMASTQDFYTCAASRYFKYFTGVGVNLMDPSDPSNQPAIAAMSAKDQEYYNYVTALGRELKATGSLKTLIKHILQSDYYKLAGFGR